MLFDTGKLLLYMYVCIVIVTHVCIVIVKLVTAVFCIVTVLVLLLVHLVYCFFNAEGSSAKIFNNCYYPGVPGTTYDHGFLQLTNKRVSYYDRKKSVIKTFKKLAYTCILTTVPW